MTSGAPFPWIDPTVEALAMFSDPAGEAADLGALLVLLAVFVEVHAADEVNRTRFSGAAIADAVK